MFYLKKYISRIYDIDIIGYEEYCSIKICGNSYDIGRGIDDKYFIYAKKMPILKAKKMWASIRSKSIYYIWHVVFLHEKYILVSDRISRYEIYFSSIADIIEDITEYNNDTIIVNIYR